MLSAPDRVKRSGEYSKPKLACNRYFEKNEGLGNSGLMACRPPFYASVGVDVLIAPPWKWAWSIFKRRDEDIEALPSGVIGQTLILPHKPDESQVYRLPAGGIFGMQFYDLLACGRNFQHA